MIRYICWIKFWFLQEKNPFGKKLMKIHQWKLIKYLFWVEK